LTKGYNQDTIYFRAAGGDSGPLYSALYTG